MNRRPSKRPFLPFVIALFLSAALLSACTLSELSAGDPVEGWAVLAEKDFYQDVDMTDLSVDYINIARMRQALEASGWNPDHIHELREFNRETLQPELDWLEEQTDENDIVLLYVASHGAYLSGPMAWQSTFAGEWEQISSHKRLLVIDACQAASFIKPISGDPAPYLSIAAVAGYELSWCGLEEEGLPIIGGVFTYYFSDAFNNPETDADGDGKISVQEAALMAEEQQRAYMHDTVLVVPEFLEMFHDLDSRPEKDPNYPNVVVDDKIGEPLYLALDGQ